LNEATQTAEGISAEKFRAKELHMKMLAVLMALAILAGPAFAGGSAEKEARWWCCA